MAESAIRGKSFSFAVGDLDVDREIELVEELIKILTAIVKTSQE